MARWRRVQLAPNEVLVVEANGIQVTVYGTGEARIVHVAEGELPEWRRPPLARIVPARREVPPEGEEE